MESTLLAPAIARALKNLQFGSVQLIVHEGEVVRIERVERIRLTDQPGGRDQPMGRPTSCEEERRDERA